MSATLDRRSFKDSLESAHLIRRINVILKRLYFCLFAAFAISGCSLNSGTPSVNHTPSVQHLYVGNDNVAGGVSQFALPLTASSLPTFTIVSNNTTAIGLDAAGDLAVGDSHGQILFYPTPLSASSTPTASFNNGAGNNTGALVFTSAGDLVATSAGTTVNLFTHPFANASVPSTTITNPGITGASGAAIDGSGNLYISNSAATSSLFVFAPPYTGAPVNSPLITAPPFYRKIAGFGNQLVVAGVNGGIGQLDVYSVPITNTSTPAFSITNGVNGPEAVAFDASGNLYVGNVANHTVTVYAQPLTAVSAPTVTLSVPGNPFIFALNIGP